MGRLGVHDTPYTWGFYRATASFRKAKNSLSSVVESSVSQASAVPTSPCDAHARRDERREPCWL